MAELSEGNPHFRRAVSFPAQARLGFGFPFETQLAQERVDYVSLFRRLWRQKLFIIVMTALCMVGTGLVVSMVPAHYVAHALLLVGSRDAGAMQVPLGRGDIDEHQADPQLVATDVEMLQSPALAAEIVRDLQLYNLPEFDPSLKSASGWSKMVHNLAGWLPGAGQQTPASPAVQVSETVQNFLARLHVDVKGTSRVIDVGFDSRDPQLAASVANSVVQHYIADASAMQTHSMQKMADWLHDKIVGLQASVQKAETAVEQFRTSSGLYETADGTPFALKQMQDVQNQLAVAQADQAALGERLSTARESSAQSDGTIGSSNSSVLSALQGQMATLQQQLAQSSATLGPSNPKIIAMNAEIASVQSKIRAARSNAATDAVKGIENQAKVAAIKTQYLTAKLDQLQNSVEKMDTAQITLRKLERDVEANRVVLTNFISRYTEASLDSDKAAQNPEVRMVSSAEAPAIPDRPKRGLLVLILGACAFFGSSALALFRQNASHNFQSMEELEAAIGVKALGLVPLAKAARISPFWGTRYGCTYREAVRSIYANLFLLRGESSKTTVLTSAFPGEGKTTLALSLAAMARLSGHRTVLIDADFFRAGASTALGLHGKAGLTEVLDQKITLAQALISDASSCIDIITPGQFSRNSGLPSIEKLTALVIEPLQQRGYEFIIIDTPPLFTVSESLILAAHADATVIAVRWGQTARNAVELMTKRLRESGAILAGFVLTMVDKRQHARYGDIYGLAETAYFSRENADYYTQPPALVPPDPRNMVVGALRTAWNRLGIAVIAIATTNFVSLGSCWRASQRNTALRRSKLSSAQPRKALLIVDVQTDFVEAAGLYALPRATTDRLIDQINHIARMIHDTGTIVVYIQQEFDSGRAKLAARLALGRKAGDAASQNRLDPRIESGGRYFLATNFADAFSNPKLENFLRSREVDHVFMVGIEGLLSIQQTAKSALRRGYSVTFIRDAIATASEKAWQRILTKYETEAAFAISSQEFIELSRDSGRALPPMQSAAIGANGF